MAKQSISPVKQAIESIRSIYQSAVLDQDTKVSQLEEVKEELESLLDMVNAKLDDDTDDDDWEETNEEDEHYD